MVQLLCKIGLSKVEAEILQFGLSSDRTATVSDGLPVASRPSVIIPQAGILLFSGNLYLPPDLALQILIGASCDLRLLGRLSRVSRSWNHLTHLADAGEKSIWRCQASRLGISQHLSPCSWKTTVQHGGAFVRQILGAARAFLALPTPHPCAISERPNSLHLRFSPLGTGQAAPAQASVWVVAQPFFRCPESGFGCPLSRAILRGVLGAGWQDGGGGGGGPSRADMACAVVQSARLATNQTVAYLARLHSSTAAALDVAGGRVAVAPSAEVHAGSKPSAPSNVRP